MLSASTYDDTVAWYRNDGSQSFTERFITTLADSAKAVFAIDVDGDGDPVVTGPARPKNARSLSATNRDEPRTPKYISETLNSFSTSLVPCKTTSRKRARARAAENTKKIK